MVEIKRSAEVAWSGDVRHGSGRITSGSGGLRDLPYTWAGRFENATGTNPEELIAAAHAACYSMAFASALGRKGYQPQRIDTHATCTMIRDDSGVRIAGMHLKTRAQVPGIDQEVLLQTAKEAERDCPVSRALRGGVPIELDATLG